MARCEAGWHTVSARRQASPRPRRFARVSARPRGIRIVVLLMASALAAWLAGSTVARRTHRARLPQPPTPSSSDTLEHRQIRDADAAARANPTDANSVGDLGLVYHASLDTARALQTYAIGEGLAPTDWRWTYYRGLLHEERGEQEAAAARFARVTAAAPHHGLAWYRLAEIAFKQGQADAAADAYQKARAAPPATSQLAGQSARKAIPLAAYADIGLARLAIERGRVEEARARLDELIRAYPAFGPARTLRVQMAHADRPPDGTPLRAPPAHVPPVDPWLDAVVARSWNTDLLLKHAALAARGGDQAWREFLVRRALEANPRSLDVLMEMASALQSTNRHGEALEYLRRCEEIAPGEHHTLVEQGRSLTELGRLEEAELVLRRVRVRDAAAEYNLGTVLDRQDRWDEARQHYERALAIDPFHTRALNNLASGLDQRGESPAAMALYIRASRAAPTNAEVHSNLGAAFIRRRRVAEALRALDTAIALDPNAPDARNNRGIALAQSGRMAEARAAFETALRLAPTHADARRNLAAITR